MSNVTREPEIYQSPNYQGEPDLTYDDISRQYSP